MRFWCPELTQEGQWHYLMLIFHRAGIMKNSSVSLFVDGDHVDTQKVSNYCDLAEQKESGLVSILNSCCDVVFVYFGG